MKIRIRGNSLRLRLDMREIETLAFEGRVEETCRFGSTPEGRLGCLVKAVKQDTLFRVAFVNSMITVFVRLADAKILNKTDKVGISGTQDVGDGQLLSITLEKDFQCLTTREGEDDSHAYPNPQQTHPCD